MVCEILALQNRRRAHEQETANSHEYYPLCVFNAAFTGLFVRSEVPERRRDHTQRVREGNTQSRW